MIPAMGERGGPRVAGGAPAIMSAFSAVDALALATFACAFALFFASSKRVTLGRRLLIAALILAALALAAGLALFYRPQAWAGLLASALDVPPLSAAKLIGATLFGAFLGRKLRRRAAPVSSTAPMECAPERAAPFPFLRHPFRSSSASPEPVPPATTPGRQAPQPRASLFRPPQPSKTGAHADAATPPGRSPSGAPWRTGAALLALLAGLGLAPDARAQAKAQTTRAAAKPKAQTNARSEPAAVEPVDPEKMRRAMLRALIQSSQIVFQKEGEAIVAKCRCGPRLGDAGAPKLVADVLVGTEDRRFYDHYGVDPIGTARGALRIFTRRRAEGGSTLTQQLVKNAILTPERSLSRKAQEAQLAFAVEKAMNKREILAAYLDHAPFGASEGREIIGARQAALHYFGRELKELNLGEAAGLIGMLKAPTSYSPLRHPEAFAQRRAVVLDGLEAAGAFPKAQIAAARKPLRPRGPKRPDWAETRWFVEIATAELKHRIPDFKPEPGLRVATPFVYDRQNALETGLAQGLARLATKLPLEGAQLAAVALGYDGRLLAVAGGRDYGASSFNRALVMARPAASTAKVFVYAAALEAGTKPTPALREAFAKSDNETAVATARAVGVERIERMARRHGIASPMTIRDPSNVALGANGVGIVEMTGAMLPYVNAGRAVRPYATFGVWRDGEPMFWKEPKAPERALSAKLVAGMTPMLRAVVTQGTALGHVRPSLTASGKTGTSDDNRDGWFVGYTPRHVLGVWLGRDDNQPVPGLTGGATSELFDAAAAALAAQTPGK
jgi:penicillin-binding protein 1A